MNKANGGFIFLMTLNMVLIISLLLVTELHHLLLYHKALNKQELQHQSFYQLELTAIQLARLPIEKSCIKSSDSANKTLHQLMQSQGCSLRLGGGNYRYLIEDLGFFPCLIIYQKKQPYETHHLRISLLLEAPNELGASALQVRIIQPAGASNCEEERVLRTNAGISSWRYFPEVLLEQKE